MVAMKNTLLGATAFLVFCGFSAVAKEPAVLTDYTGPLLYPYGHGTSANGVINGIDWRETNIGGPKRLLTFRQKLPIDEKKLRVVYDRGDAIRVGTLASHRMGPSGIVSCRIEFSDTYSMRPKPWYDLSRAELPSGYEAGTTYYLKSVSVRTYDGNLFGGSYGTDRVLVTMSFLNSEKDQPLRALLLVCEATRPSDPRSETPAEAARELLFNLSLESLQSDLAIDGKPIFELSIQKH
jgi:hypothetical protein